MCGRGSGRRISQNYHRIFFALLFLRSILKLNILIRGVAAAVVAGSGLLLAPLVEPGCLGHSSRGARVWCGRTGVDVTSPGQSRELPSRAPPNPPVSLPSQVMCSRVALTCSDGRDLGRRGLAFAGSLRSAYTWLVEYLAEFECLRKCLYSRVASNI